jgi:hypothetical protein
MRKFIEEYPAVTVPHCTDRGQAEQIAVRQIETRFRREEPRGFLMVDNVREVEKLIRETLLDRLTDRLVE